MADAQPLNDEQKADYVAALNAELAGYEAAGKNDRAEQVRDELARVTGRKQSASKQAVGKQTTATDAPPEKTDA